MIHFVSKQQLQQQKIQFEKQKQAKKILDKQKEIQQIINDHNAKIRIMNTYNKLNIPFQFKETYQSIIPLKLYTCWHTKNLPPFMQHNYQLLQENNHEFNHYLYDENECRNFIQNNFDEDVLNAYDSLIPCSYKSDLWRYCILYINGGIYLDIKYQCVNNFKFIALTEHEHFVRDRPKNCMYTAFIISLPKNEILLKCINQIVINVQNKFYGENPLYPTGPGLLGSYFTDEEYEKSEINFNLLQFNNLKKECIFYNHLIILENYNEYREEQSQFQKNKHYDQLWKDNNIYI